MSATSSDVSSSSAAASQQQEVKKKRVMVGLVGHTFSNQFIMSWTKFLVECMKDGTIDISIFPGNSTFSTFSRMKTLGLTKQEVQTKAFDGVDYDVFLTVDSNVLFTYEDVKTLVGMTDKNPVVSGVYYTSEKTVHAVERMDYTNYGKTGTFPFVTKETMEDLVDTKLMKVDYTGLGFFACRRTVLQALDYPYFWYPLVDYESEDGTPCKDVLTDEMAFCRRLCDKGYRITLNTELRVHQEKEIFI